MTWVAAATGASAAISLGTAAVKGIKGGKQIKKGLALDKNNVRPTYTRPGEVTQALNLAERNFTNGMPGSDMALSRIGTSAAGAYDAAMQGASSSGDVLDAATKINGNVNDATNNLLIQEQNFKNNAMQNYIGQLNNNATYTDKEFDYNQNQPFQEDAAKAASLIGAGNQNQFSALNDVGQVASSALMMGLNGGFGFEKPATMGEKTGAIQPINSSIKPITKTPQIPNAFNPVTMGNLPEAIQPVNSSIQPITQTSQIPNTFNPGSMGRMVYDTVTKTYRFI